MLNFKKVLLGLGNNLDVREQSQWPELGKIKRENMSLRSAENNFEVNEEMKSSETNIETQNCYHNVVSQPSSSKHNLPSSCDFPEFTVSISNQLLRRGRNNILGLKSEHTQVNRESSSKFKKPKKAMSKEPISIDINAMLQISLKIAERKRLHKRKLHPRMRSLPFQEHKSSACGNKLDSDCPVRHKGKKRPHKRRKPTTIKRDFLWAAKKLSLIPPNGMKHLRHIILIGSGNKGQAIDELVTDLGGLEISNVQNKTTDEMQLSPVDSHKTAKTSEHFAPRVNLLRHTILAGIRKGQAVDEILAELVRLGITDVQEKRIEEVHLLPKNILEIAKLLVHTKNFRPYCDHIVKPSLKKVAREFVRTLRIYQDKMHARDPISSKSKRRYVCGCHEARKFLMIGSVQLLFIANDIITDNGMPPILEELINISRELELPVIYASSAKDFGFWTLKGRKTSVIAILNYEGAEKLFTVLLEELEIAKQYYLNVIQLIGLHLQKGIEIDATNLDKNELLQKELEQQIKKKIISKLS